MQFLRTLFWVVLAVFLAIIARNNWSDVTINLWGSLQAEVEYSTFLPDASLYRIQLEGDVNLRLEAAIPKTHSEPAWRPRSRSGCCTICPATASEAV